MKKRILQFIGSFHQGGTERQAISLARLLKEDGTYDIYAATLNNEGVLRPEIESIGLPPIPEYPLTSFFNPNFVRQVRLCAKYLRDNRIDLVHTHDFYTNVFGMAAATLAGIPARIASKRETGGMRSAGQEFVEKLAFGRATAITVNSAAVREHLIDRSIPEQKIHIIYNGVNLERFDDVAMDRDEIVSKYDLPGDKNIRFITLVANLRHRVKNVPMLIRAAKRVVESEPNTHFVIAGEGELKTELTDLARHLDVANHIHFIGRCTDVPALLSISYACVLTSNAEGFSNSILEYMAAGKPVVATNVGGASEVIKDGDNGYLVKTDDDAAMADRVLELLNDKDRSFGIGQKGRRTVESRYSQADQLSSIKKLYQSPDLFP